MSQLSRSGPWLIWHLCEIVTSLGEPPTVEALQLGQSQAIVRLWTVREQGRWEFWPPISPASCREPFPLNLSPATSLAPCWLLIRTSWKLQKEMQAYSRSQSSISTLSKNSRNKTHVEPHHFGQIYFGQIGSGLLRANGICIMEQW